MASVSGKCDPPSRPWRSIGLTLLAVVLIALLVGAWMVYSAASTSLEAEENLHATLFVIQLVEQFVQQNKRWPASWEELERTSFPSDAPTPANGELSAVRIGGAHGYAWPEQSPHLKECVHIDFLADTESIAKQDPMEFQAIRPIGPCYEYRDYGFVQSLQETLRKVHADGTVD